MGSFSLGKIGVASSVILLLSTGCLSQKSLTQLGTGYEQANKGAVDIVATESKEVKRVRRVAAAVAYVNAPSLSTDENINPNHISESFANFVCTGEDTFNKTNAGLKFTSEYAKTVKSITAAPEDSIGGYVKALSALRGKDKALEVPEPKSDQFQTCCKEVSNDIPPKGIPAVTVVERPPTPAAIAAIAAMQSMIGSLQEIVQLGLRLTTEAKQREVLKKFLRDNEAKYNEVQDKYLSSDELKNAFSQRRQTAVALPYYEFVDMMHLKSPDAHRTQIIQMATKIDKDLQEYDAIRVQPAPEKVVGKFKEINEKLKDYLDGNISLAETIQFLLETASELQDAKKEYDSVAKSLNALRDALNQQ